MKKSIFKLMTAVVGVAALASCSDDLGLGSKAISSKADLTATIEDPDAKFTRLGISEVEGTNPWDYGKASNWGWVFTEGDEVRVFTLEQMTYNYYDLIAGENTNEGEFKMNTEKSAGALSGGQKYALTDAQFVYGVSPMSDGTPRLTYTIPYAYTANSIEVAADDNPDVDVRKFPAPFWGKATETPGEEGVKLDVRFMALTAFLRIDMQELPDNTNYIVLTTHGSRTAKTEDDLTQDELDAGLTGGIEEDGFRLVRRIYDDEGVATENVKFMNTDGKVVTEKYAKTMAFWEKVLPTTDGASEKLSGTFNAKLEDNKSALEEDKGLDGDDWEMAGISRLVNRDQIVIKITEAAKKEGVFWIPLIAQHYDNLYVMAVEEFGKYTYSYIGTELKQYHDFTANVGSRYRLTLNITNLGKVCANELNEAIAKINKANKYKMNTTNIINVEELTDCWHTAPVGSGCKYHANEATYPTDQILAQGDGNLVLNIAKISATAKTKNGPSPVRTDLMTTATTNDLKPDLALEKKTLFVSDKNYWGDAIVIREGKQYKTDTQESDLSVTINLPAKKDEMRPEVEALMSDLPTYNAIFATNNDFYPAEQSDAKDLVIHAHATATKFVSGLDVQEIDENNNIVDVKDETSAAIKVINGIKELNVLQYTSGDVYVVPETGKRVEINDRLNVWSREGVSTRLDNALVKYIFYRHTDDYSGYRVNNTVVTTGNSAIQRIGALNYEDQEDALLKANKEGTTEAWPFDLYYYQPNDVRVLSYWTGYALDPDADNIKDYDCGAVYTTAQLASMGEEIAGSSQAKYYIPNIVNEMWLGGYLYGWVGPEVTIKNFIFDGNGVGLYNMNMPPVASRTDGEMKQKIYTYDPHICCTTCGWKRDFKLDGDDAFAEELKSWGLIRSIINGSGTANKIVNVALNDVYAVQSEGITIGEKEYAIPDHIGCLVGLVFADHDLILDFNHVGEIQIDVPSNFVGGLIGHVLNSKDIKIIKNTASNSQYESGYIKGKNDVGGFIGRVGKSAYDQVTNQNVEDFDVTSNVPSLTIEDSEVAMAGNIEATSARAGGLLGETWIEKISISDTKVGAANIIAGSRYAGGLIADVEDKSYEPPVATTTTKKIEVNVPGKISSSENTGGQFGAIRNKQVDMISGDVTVGTINATKGFAGGEIGYSYKGIVNVGKNGEKEDFNETNINVDNMTAAIAAGGIIGSPSMNTYVYIYTGYEPTGFFKFVGNRTNIEIKAFDNTKGDPAAIYEALYKGGDNAKTAGTFSNIAGLLDGTLYIAEKGLTVKDHMTGAMKEDIGYLLHNDQGPAAPPGTLNDKVRYFWGDSNGYVGYGKSGNYYLAENAEDMTKKESKVIGDQKEKIDGFNLYKLTGGEDRNGDYFTTKSKNFAE